MNFPGLIDLHVHSSPDVRPRTCSDLDLVREASRVQARAVVIKSHHMLTADRAEIARTVAPAVAVFGGITLNPPVGGLNPDAVEVNLRLGGKIVWLPTLFSVQHRRCEGKTGGVPVVEDGQTVPAARAIFRQIAAAGAILATGHLAAAEIPRIVADAWDDGVRRILINHPEHRVVGMDIAAQRALRSEFPVYFERCYAQPSATKGFYDSNAEANLRAIEALGTDSTVLASDAGQIENPPWAECWERTFAFYERQGLAAGDFARMTNANPGALLEL